MLGLVKTNVDQSVSVQTDADWSTEFQPNLNTIVTGALGLFVGDQTISKIILVHFYSSWMVYDFYMFSIILAMYSSLTDIDLSLTKITSTGLSVSF